MKSFREGCLSGIRAESDHAGETAGRAFPDKNVGYAHGENDAWEFVIVRRPYFEAVRSALTLQTKWFVESVLHTA